jgi:glycosyltransferase XagB
MIELIYLLIGGLLTGLAIIWAIINLYAVYPLLKEFFAKLPRRDRVEAAPIALDNIPLPKFSILLPAYKEEEVVVRCITRIYHADYPKELIEVVVLTEKDDAKTNAIVEECVGVSPIKHVVIEDDGEPRGKPRALNQGFRHTTGEIIGVIDAEDLIDPQLFRKVAVKMTAGDYDVVQGILDMKNEDDGWLNRSFRAEYGYWYRKYLPLLSETGLPIPLGGTTNFFRRSSLEEVGLWDTKNLTEDFEIGMRLYCRKKRFGTSETGMIQQGTPSGIIYSSSKYNVGLLDSITEEESPVTKVAWIKQRTRWERGKVQTLMKYMRMREFSPTMAVNIGLTALMSHLGAVNVIGISLSALALLLGVPFPAPLLGLFLFNAGMVIFHCTTQFQGYLYASEKGKAGRKINALEVAVTAPAYWVLQWYADLRALKQEYFGSKVFWEKTEHHGRNVEEKSTESEEDLILPELTIEARLPLNQSN